MQGPPANCLLRPVMVLIFFIGSVVIINATGTIELCTDIGSAGDPFPAGTIGVFMGCSYTDATLGFVNRQYWPTGQVASDALAFIVDDPNVAFQIQGDAAMTQITLGMNAPLANVQSTSTGSIHAQCIGNCSIISCIGTQLPQQLQVLPSESLILLTLQAVK